MLRGGVLVPKTHTLIRRDPHDVVVVDRWGSLVTKPNELLHFDGHNNVRAHTHTRERAETAS